MCGRYASTRSAADLSVLFEAADETRDGETQDADAREADTQDAGTRDAGAREAVAPRWNLAPTDPAPVVRVSRESGARVLSVARWGLLPHWARSPREGARMINARAETVATARAYAESFATRRALVPADGWFEWRRHEGGKQPYYLTPRDGTVLALAGVWSRWGPDRLLTFSIVTTAAAGEPAAIHDRMPLALPPASWQEWLAGDAPEALLNPPAADTTDLLEVRPVGPAVGNVRNDGPELVARVTPAAEPLW